jgi:hypothetical protein
MLSAEVFFMLLLLFVTLFCGLLPQPVKAAEAPQPLAVQIETGYPQGVGASLFYYLGPNFALGGHLGGVPWSGGQRLGLIGRIEWPQPGAFTYVEGRMAHVQSGPQQPTALDYALLVGVGAHGTDCDLLSRVALSGALGLHLDSQRAFGPVVQLALQLRERCPSSNHRENR